MTYWTLDLNPPNPLQGTPHNSSILIIGTGLAGVSTAYFLLQQGYKDVALVDCGSQNASYFRNAGHILHGASENYKAMCSIHGREKAKTIFQLSERFCHEIQNTIQTLDIACDYHKGDYLTVGANLQEQADLIDSVQMMHADGFYTSSMCSNVGDYGFRDNDQSARLCQLSAQANPAKFRHQLLQYILDQGIKYYSCKVQALNDSEMSITYCNDTKSYHDAVVIAANAYSPLFSRFFQERQLVDPFKGQIIVSAPMKHPWPRMQFSMDHGYIYGTTTADNRLLIGGWRNNIPGGEVGSYELNLNPLVENGLKEFVKNNFKFENLEWEYSWAGIMGSSQTGFPFIGPTNNPMVFTLAGCTGYGFGWFHGAAKMLAGMIVGNAPLEGYQYFNPNKI